MYMLTNHHKGTMTKKRIKTKHQHHEEVLRKQIEEEVKLAFCDDTLRKEIEEEVKAKYVSRIDYLVGANNELYRDLLKAEATVAQNEQELTHDDYISSKDCVSIPNKVADCIVLEENF